MNEEQYDDLFSAYRAARNAAQDAVRDAENKNELIAAHVAVVEMHGKLRKASDEYIRQHVAKGDDAPGSAADFELMKRVKGQLPMTPARIAFEEMRDEMGCFGDIDEENKGRLEEVILNSPDGPEYAFHVANKIRRGKNADAPGPWPEGEHRISESPQWSYLYSTMALKGRFKIGERAMKADEYYWEKYTRKFGIRNEDGTESSQNSANPVE
jgi:hypothetical protein